MRTGSPPWDGGSAPEILGNTVCFSRLQTQLSPLALTTNPMAFMIQKRPNYKLDVLVSTFTYIVMSLHSPNARVWEEDGHHGTPASYGDPCFTRLRGFEPIMFNTKPLLGGMYRVPILNFLVHCGGWGWVGGGIHKLEEYL